MEVKVEAQALLSAAAAERRRGQLGAALDLAERAHGEWPGYGRARQFVAEVAPQATATVASAATATAATVATATAASVQATAAQAQAVQTAQAQAAATAQARAAERPFGYGATIADASPAPGRSFDLARQAGFTHAYVVLDWANVQRDGGRFAWDTGEANDLDNFLSAARATGLRLIVRLDRPRGWSGSLSALDPGAMEHFAAGVAGRARGSAAAYEVLNEPNLPYEWGGPPDPAAYARLLAAAARGIKGADPSAAVLAAGLAPHTGGQGGSIEDVDFLRGMYRAGARGTFDALGIHAYGGTSAPAQQPPSCGICFRRAERYRQVMVEHGDAATPAWITEVGYLHATGTALGTYNWMKVGPEQQASYLAAAFQYALEHWPWLGGIVVFNLDFATVPWNPPTAGAYWLSLLHPDGSPRPAYTALREMAKPGAAEPLPTGR